MSLEPLLLLALAGGYLLGSVPFGLVLVRLSGLGDIREIGSGNIGATNVLRTGRKDLAVATLILDSGKAGFACLGFTYALGPVAGLVAGAAAFFGHCYPVWLGFKGGKGVATFLGVLMAAAWPVGLLACATWLGTAMVSRLSSLSALVAAAASPVFALAVARPDVAAMAGLLTILIFWRHRANLSRLIAGEEPLIGAGKG